MLTSSDALFAKTNSVRVQINGLLSPQWATSFPKTRLPWYLTWLTLNTRTQVFWRFCRMCLVVFSLWLWGILYSEQGLWDRERDVCHLPMKIRLQNLLRPLSTDVSVIHSLPLCLAPSTEDPSASASVSLLWETWRCSFKMWIRRKKNIRSKCKAHESLFW